MTKKTSITIAAAIVLLGTASYLALRPSPAEAKDLTKAAPALPPDASRPANTPESLPAEARKRGNQRDGQASDIWPELAEKYGKTRTNFARSLVDKIPGLVDELAAKRETEDVRALYQQMGDMSVLDLSEKVHLTDEQIAAAKALIVTNRELLQTELKNLSAAIRNDPRPMMELSLAGDAYSKKEISKEDYQAVVTRTRESFEAAGANPRIRGFEDPLAWFREPGVHDGLQKLLNPAQSEAFRKVLAPAQDGSVPLPDTDFTKLPPRKLETFEASLDSLIPEG